MFKKFILICMILSFRPIGAFASGKCSASRIVHFASIAQNSVQNGRLWGHRICDSATKAHGYLCYNGCARVVSSILRKAGCHVSYTSSASAVWNRMKRYFEPSPRQRAGCIIGFNSRNTGRAGRLSLPGHGGGSVAFRHVAIAVGSWSYVDNESRANRLTIATNRGFGKLVDRVVYEAPLFLCPPSSGH